MPNWLRKLFGLPTDQELKAEQEAEAKRLAEQQAIRDKFFRETATRRGKSRLGGMAEQRGIRRQSTDDRIRGMQANVVITDDIVANQSFLSRDDNRSKNEHTSSPHSSSYCESNNHGGSHSASHSSDSSSSSFDFSSSCCDSSSSYSSCDSGSSSYSYD